MAQEAQETMDAYVSASAPNERGYFGLIVDFFHNQFNDGQIRSWGRPRAAAAIGSMMAVFRDALGSFNPPSCGEKDCQPKATRGNDTPDDNASNLDAFRELSSRDATELLADSDRLAAKKGRRQLVDWQLLVRWYTARESELLSQQKYDNYVATIKYRGDEGAYFQDYVASPDAAILANGFALQAGDLVKGEFGEPIVRIGVEAVGAQQVSDHPILVIPSGGLYGLSLPEQFKAGLESYVRAGGSVLVFAQQHGSDFSVLPTPDGRPIHGWGWHEDNSCYTNAAYIETLHPMLASQSRSLVTSNIDGYFDSIPDNAIVLLRRVKNGLPAMFMYSYGQGWVIVSSSYDDWGGFNQTGPGARAIIRDAIAWAKKPADLPINAPGSTVAIALQVKNITDLPAGQVKLVLMSPSRDRVVAEQTISQSVAAGETAEVPFSYAFPEDAELGIYHVDYELLDDAGVTIQPIAEEDTGRIVVAKPPTPGQYRASDLGVSVVMPGGEEVLEGQPAVFRYRLQNHSSSSKHLRAHFDLNHSPATLAEDLVLAGGATFEEEITVTARGAYPQRFWVHENPVPLQGHARGPATIPSLSAHIASEHQVPGRLRASPACRTSTWVTNRADGGDGSHCRPNTLYSHCEGNDGCGPVATLDLNGEVRYCVLPGRRAIPSHGRLGDGGGSI